MGKLDGHLIFEDMKESIMKLFCALVLGLGLSVQGLDAQVAQYKLDLESFTAISAANDFKLNIVQGEGYSADISVNETLKDYVQIAVSEGVLNIYFEDKKVPSETMKPFRGRNASSPIFNVKVTMPAVLKVLSLSNDTVLQGLDNVSDTTSFIMNLSDNASVESAQINSRVVNINSTRKGGGTINVKGDRLALTAKGAAEIIINQEVKDTEYTVGTNTNLLVNGICSTFKLNSSGTSKTIVNGECEYARYQISGSSNVNALNLKAKEANVDMNSICSLTQSASDWLFINISNGATLTYAGEPQIHVNSIRTASVLRYQEEEK